MNYLLSCELFQILKKMFRAELRDKSMGDDLIIAKKKD